MNAVASLPSPTPVSGTPAVATTQLSELLGQQLGQIISGLVLALIDDTTLRLQVPAGVFDVQVDTPLPPGTPVSISVHGTPQQPELVVTASRSDFGRVALQPEQTANEAEPQPAAADAASPATTTPSSAASTTPPAANASVENTTSSAANTVSSAANTTSSGVATTAGATQTNTVELAAPNLPTSTAASPLLQAALSSATAIVRNAATSQGGLATLYANLETIVAEPSPTVPAPVLAAAKQMLAMRFDIGSNGTIDADDIKSALIRSGLVAQPATAGTPQPSVPDDVGSALVVLRQVLKTWLDTEPDTKAIEAPPQSPATTPTTAPAPRTAVATTPNRVQTAVPQTAAAASPSASSARTATAPMPPYRGAPTVAQAPAAPSLPAGATPRELAAHLLNQADAAIARQTLLRIASLPAQQSGGAGTTRTQADATRLMFDIPVATAQGTGVAQMAIERDGSQRHRQSVVPVWRATFSIDLEPIGAVHVRITLAGDLAAVTLNAERTDSADLLSAGLPRLEAGLRGADLEPGELRCRSGAPRPPAAATPGAFVDQAT